MPSKVVVGLGAVGFFLIAKTLSSHSYRVPSLFTATLYCFGMFLLTLFVAFLAYRFRASLLARLAKRATDLDFSLTDVFLNPISKKVWLSGVHLMAPGSGEALRIGSLQAQIVKAENPRLAKKDIIAVLDDVLVTINFTNASLQDSNWHRIRDTVNKASGPSAPTTDSKQPKEQRLARVKLTNFRLLPQLRGDSAIGPIKMGDIDMDPAIISDPTLMVGWLQKTAAQALIDHPKALVGDLGDTLHKNANILISSLGHLPDPAQLGENFQGAAGEIGGALDTVASGALNNVRGGFDTVRGGVSDLGSVITDDIVDIDGVKGAATGALGDASGAFEKAGGTLSDLISGKERSPRKGCTWPPKPSPPPAMPRHSPEPHRHFFKGELGKLEKGVDSVVDDIKMGLGGLFN